MDQARTDDQYVDGNVLAGPLSEVFTFDPTSAIGRCATCGSAGPLAALHVYTHAPGLVARCPHCDDVMLMLVEDPHGVRLDMRGAAALTVPLAG